MTIDEHTARLAQIALQIESHRTATWLLENERLELQHRLRALNFTPLEAA